MWLVKFNKLFRNIKIFKTSLLSLVWMNFLKKISFLFRELERFKDSYPSLFHVAEIFTGRPGKYVPLKETVAGFKEIIEGKCDDMPEQAFYMVGNIEEAREEAKKLKDKEEELI